MGDSSEPGLTSQGAKVVCDLSGVELPPVIQDHCTRDTEAGDDELLDFNNDDGTHEFCLDLLCKVIYGDEEVLTLPCGLWERPQYIHTPSDEW